MRRLVWVMLHGQPSVGLRVWSDSNKCWNVPGHRRGKKILRITEECYSMLQHVTACYSLSSTWFNLSCSMRRIWPGLLDLGLVGIPRLQMWGCRLRPFPMHSMESMDQRSSPCISISEAPPEDPNFEVLHFECSI